MNIQPKKSDNDNDIQHIWYLYKEEGGIKVRFWRIFPVAITWWGLCVVLYMIQAPNIPASDAWAYWTDIILTQATFFAFLLVFAFVSDATMHCNQLIQQLIDKHSNWPFMEEVNSLTKGKKIVQNVKREWNEIKLIGMRSEDISNTVYYPIYIILLLLAAQSDYFDNFDMPTSLMLIATLNISLVLVFSVLLRRKAIKARKESLANTWLAETEALALQNSDERGFVLDKVRFYKMEIENIREGAFLPISEQPWLRALTLMGGGGGSLLLLQAMAG